jgi:predicted signal transduction protein with EAL and GGDEF domain
MPTIEAEKTFRAENDMLRLADSQFEECEKALQQAKFESLLFISNIDWIKKEMTRCEVDMKVACHRQTGLDAEKQKAIAELARAVANPDKRDALEKALGKLRRVERDIRLALADSATSVAMSAHYKNVCDAMAAAQVAAEKRIDIQTGESEAARSRRDSLRERLAGTRLKLAELRQKTAQPNAKN